MIFFDTISVCDHETFFKVYGTKDMHMFARTIASVVICFGLNHTEMPRSLQCFVYNIHYIIPMTILHLR